MPTNQTDLRGKTIVIVGASSGFGRGTALKLGELGAKVVLAARREAALHDLAEHIRSAGGEALAVGTDVSKAPEVERLARAAEERFGVIDIWINNAGIGALGPFWDIPLEDHARVIDVNLKGLIFGAHAAIRRFRAQGFGTLINVGSIDSEVPLAYQASYAASKAAVLSLGRALEEELRLDGSVNIKIATIMPWAVDTPWWLHAANYSGHAPRMAAMDDPSLVVDAIVEACANPQGKTPVGTKAGSSNLSHYIFPDLTERLSANISHREIQKAPEVASTTGAIYEPMASTLRVEGGIRERMKREDAEDGE